MWQYDDDTIQAWFGGAIYQMWQAWKHHGKMPTSGGWLDQPLSLWVQIQAIDLVHDTWAYKNAKGSDWATLSPTQLEIIRQLDG